MITAIVGCMDESEGTPISGNGKGVTNTGLAYLNHIKYHKRIWSNYTTDFSEKVCGLQEMIDTVGDEPQPDLIFVITEMGKVLNSLGSPQRKVLYVENFVRQLRKLEIDFQFDEQRFKTVHLRLRNFTDKIFIPMKFHTDYEPCNYNLCKKPHYIAVYSQVPKKPKPVIIFDATKVGQHYNTNEICYDQLILRKGDE